MPDQSSPLPEGLRAALAEFAELTAKRLARELAGHATPLPSDQRILANVIDVILLAVRFRAIMLSRSSEPPKVTAARREAATALAMLSEQLQFALAACGVVAFGAEAGDSIDCRRHEVIHRVPTDQFAPGKVVEIVELGFVQESSGKVVKKAVVFASAPTGPGAP